jgi:hypothetical protein
MRRPEQSTEGPTVAPEAAVPVSRQAEWERACVRALPWQWASSGLNTFFALWTFAGSVFLLFLSELGLPKAQIGAVLSLFPRQTPNAVGACAVLYAAYGVASGGVGIGAGRLLFNGVVPPERNTAYTAIYYAWMGLTGGVAPLLAGALLGACGEHSLAVGPVAVDGYHVLFGLAVVMLTLGWRLYGRVKPDDVHTTRDPGGEHWAPRVEVVKPGVLHQDTCSYCSLLPLAAGTALIGYSEFNLSGPDGTPRKSIRARRVTATREGER